MLVTLCEILGCAFVGKREKCESIWRVAHRYVVKKNLDFGIHLGPIFALEYKQIHYYPALLRNALNTVRAQLCVEFCASQLLKASSVHCDNTIPPNKVAFRLKSRGLDVLENTTKKGKKTKNYIHICRFILWQAPQAVKTNQIPRWDWLPEREN